jgi:hypothetical protein
VYAGRRRRPLPTRMRALSNAFWAAVSSAHATNLWIEGGINCGQWLQAREDRQSAVYEAYVVGVLNEMSMGSGVSIWSGQPRESPVVFLG